MITGLLDNKNVVLQVSLNCVLCLVSVLMSVLIIRVIPKVLICLRGCCIPGLMGHASLQVIELCYSVEVICSLKSVDDDDDDNDDNNNYYYYYNNNKKRQ